MVPVRYFAPIPPGDAGTLGYTVPWMHRLISEGARDPGIQAKGRELAMAGDPVDAAFRFVQSIPYRRDPEEYEMLQGAPWLLRRAQAGEGYSDCDCRVILLGSLLESMGYKQRLALIRAPGKDSFSHVYQEVWRGGRWVPLDTIFPAFRAGDEVRDVTRTKKIIPPPAGLGSEWGLAQKLPHYQQAVELAAKRFGPMVPGLESLPVVTRAIPLAAEAAKRAKQAAIFILAAFFAWWLMTRKR